MSSYSKHKDIEAVMQKAEGEIVKIEENYKGCLKEQVIPPELLVDVKAFMSNIRSALDYLWCKVPNVGNGGHFPVANSQNEFVNKTQNVDQKYLTIVEKYQSYNGDKWLGDFSFIQNKNKHLTLIPQTRKETKEFTIKSKSGKGSLKFSGSTFKGNVSFGMDGIKIPIDEKTQFPTDVKGVDIDKKIWVDFLFDGSSIPDFPSGVSALPFLKQSFDKTKMIISDIEKII